MGGSTLRATALGLAAAGLLAVPVPALATFPGKNGRIVFTRDIDPDTNVNQGDIFVSNPDGSGQINLTNTPAEDEADPAFSADGRKLLFVRELPNGVPGQLEGDIFVMDADGSDQVNITNTPTVGEIEPAFSPDGSKVVFLLDTIPANNSSSFDIWTMDSTGANKAALLTTPGSFELEPSYSPDGSKIVWRDNNASNLFTMNADGTGVAPLTQTPGVFESFPSWTPDGRVAYSVGPVGAVDAFTINADGTGTSPLLAGPTDDYAPTFSPDGTEVVFARRIPPSLFADEVVRTTAAGAELGSVSNSPLREQEPDWGVAVECAGVTATIIGTEKPDTLIGTPGADVFSGGVGNDNIKGGKGNDLICGDQGNDKINGGRGNDKVLGGAGKDKINGAQGKDKMTGGSGKDQCTGAAGTDRAAGCEKERSL